MVLHVCFVPVLPLGTVVRWFCASCRHQLDYRRPSRPALLVTGIVAAVAMAFIGTMILLDGGERGVGLAVLILGLLLAVSLAVVIRRQDYRAYTEGKAAVVALTGEQCPCCGRTVVGRRNPRCRSCNIDIITK